MVTSAAGHLGKCAALTLHSTPLAVRLWTCRQAFSFFTHPLLSRASSIPSPSCVQWAFEKHGAISPDTTPVSASCSCTKLSSRHAHPVPSLLGHKEYRDLSSLFLTCSIDSTNPQHDSAHQHHPVGLSSSLIVEPLDQTDLRPETRPTTLYFGAYCTYSHASI